jgi:hypothetical protein
MDRIIPDNQVPKSTGRGRAGSTAYDGTMAQIQKLKQNEALEVDLAQYAPSKPNSVEMSLRGKLKQLKLDSRFHLQQIKVGETIHLYVRHGGTRHLSEEKRLERKRKADKTREENARKKAEAAKAS